jgi:hypothetical protein
MLNLNYVPLTLTDGKTYERGIKRKEVGLLSMYNCYQTYRCADKSLARPTSRCILFDGENISFDASLVIYINSTNIPPIIIINRIHENKDLLSL